MNVTGHSCSWFHKDPQQQYHRVLCSFQQLSLPLSMPSLRHHWSLSPTCCQLWWRYTLIPLLVCLLYIACIHVSAILTTFTCSVDLPTIRYIQLVPDLSSSTLTTYVPDLTGLIPYPSADFILRFGAQMRFLSSPFQIFFDLQSYVAEQHQNQAIVGLTRSVNPHVRSWPGAVVVLKRTSANGGTYTDFQLSDIEHIRAYFALLR